MIEAKNDFERWAVQNDLDIERIGYGSYLSERTIISEKAWRGCHDFLQEGVIYDYGICLDCKTHFVPKVADDGFAMECNCLIDAFRQTKIMDIYKEGKESVKC